MNSQLSGIMISPKSEKENVHVNLVFSELQVILKGNNFKQIQAEVSLITCTFHMYVY